MSKYAFVILIGISLVASACSLSKHETLVLIKSHFEDADDIDTLDVAPERGIYILQLIRYGALGRFTLHLAFEKQIGNAPTDKLRYEANTRLPYSISKDFVSLIDEKMNVANWGWYLIQDGKLSPYSLSKNYIIDSIKEANPECFIQQGNEYVRVLKDGKEVNKYNIGNFITKQRNLNFDSLDYGLYKLERDSIVRISEKGNDLVKQKDGIYFVPKPGYGIKALYRKEAILNLIDSVSKMSPSPAILTIEPATTSNPD